MQDVYYAYFGRTFITPILAERLLRLFWQNVYYAYFGRTFITPIFAESLLRLFCRTFITPIFAECLLRLFLQNVYYAYFAERLLRLFWHHGGARAQQQRLRPHSRQGKDVRQFLPGDFQDGLQ